MALGLFSDCPCVAQLKPGVKPREHLCRDLKMVVHRRFPSNLTEPERIHQEEWDKLPKSMSANLVETYPRIHRAIIAAKEASTKHRN